jgi:hypothetical protein
MMMMMFRQPCPSVHLGTKFSLYLLLLKYVNIIPSLGVRKYGLLVVSENNNVIDYNIVINALRDNTEYYILRTMCI